MYKNFGSKSFQVLRKEKDRNSIDDEGRVSSVEGGNGREKGAPRRFEAESTRLD